MINLSAYGSVETAIFLKWTVPGEDTLYLSDYHTDVTIGGNVYTNIGTLLDVGAPTSELKASKSQFTFTLSGVPVNSVADTLGSAIKGSTVEIYRGFFNPSSHSLLNLSPADNPVSKFKGIVTNYAISDEYDNVDGTATTTISLTCNSQVEILEKKVSGRRTNPTDFGDEKSMDRVRALASSNFNFGAPK